MMVFHFRLSFPDLVAKFRWLRSLAPQHVSAFHFYLPLPFLVLQSEVAGSCKDNSFILTLRRFQKATLTKAAAVCAAAESAPIDGRWME